MTETMVSIMLVVMVMAGAYGVIVQAAKLSRAARNHYIAITLAKNRLERCRGFDYIDLQLLAENNTVVDDNGTPDPRGMFRRTTGVNTNFVTNATVMTKVDVSVQIRSYRSGNFGAEKEEMSSLFTEYLQAMP